MVTRARSEIGNVRMLIIIEDRLGSWEYEKSRRFVPGGTVEPPLVVPTDGKWKTPL